MTPATAFLVLAINETTKGVQAVQSAALRQGGLPISDRIHSSNRFGQRPPPPSQIGQPCFLPLLDLPEVNIRLTDAPVAAPDKTPIPSTESSDCAVPRQHFPSIAEALQQLPSLSNEVTNGTTLVEQCQQDHGHAVAPAELVVARRVASSVSSFSPHPQHGVREHTDWQEDIEGELDRALARLANLARDDHAQDRRLTVDEHYTGRLGAALERQHTRYTYLHEAKSTITSLMIQRAKLCSMLEVIITEAVTDRQELVETVKSLLREVEDKNDGQESSIGNDVLTTMRGERS